MKFIIRFILCVFLMAWVSGCSQYKDYAETWKMLTIERKAQADADRRLVLQLIQKQELEKERLRNERLALYTKAQEAAAATENPNDDVLVSMSMVTLSLMDQLKGGSSMEALLSLQRFGASQAMPALQPPESPGKFVQRIGSTVLGLGGIYAAVNDSNNDRKVMQAMAARESFSATFGDNTRFAYDSFKSGSQNTIQGDGNSVTGGTLSGPMQSEAPAETEETNTDPENGCFTPPPETCGPSPVCIDGEWKYSADCSCPSYLADRCS